MTEHYFIDSEREASDECAHPTCAVRRPNGTPVTMMAVDCVATLLLRDEMNKLLDRATRAEADARALALAACTFATAQQVADAAPAMRRWAPAEPPQPRSAAEILEEHKEAADG